MITNTHSVGAVHQGTIAWRIRQGGPDATGYFWSTPSWPRPGTASSTTSTASTSPRATSSKRSRGARAGTRHRGQRRRRHGNDLQRLQGRHRDGLARPVRGSAGGYTVGALVQCNYGRKMDLRIAGVPVGREIAGAGARDEDAGSIIVVARDGRAASAAPAEAHGAPRARSGSRRDGAIGSQRLGRHLHRVLDGEPGRRRSRRAPSTLTMLPNDRIDPALRGGGPVRRGGRRQRDGRRRDDDRRQRPHRPRAAARRAPAHPAEVRPAGRPPAPAADAGREGRALEGSVQRGQKRSPTACQ